MWQQKRAIWIIWSQYKRNIKGTDDWCLIFNTPVLFFELLVQFELIIYRVHSPSKLLVLPGIGCGDAIGPHGEERDGPCSDSETRSVKQPCAWFTTMTWFNTPSALSGRSALGAATFCSLRRMSLLHGHARLLVERFRRVWRIFDHLWLLVVFLQQTL